MKTLIIKGWVEGLNKVALTKIIREYTGFGLAKGKLYTDQVIDNKTVQFSNLDLEASTRFLAAIQAVGAIGEIK